ncbi:hypothetical protein [Pseudomonas oryzihabitans]|jgi:hypothetical protein|uniref:DUF7740 domain-containing protein n=1 Tax=Pseudomonas oryzihabitans TaxID=47885 RepID=UPI0028953DBF|nr:hypothetical protein [Pseudomonas oryzihabitans]MDT3722852.1 hypothetical protein [Pseudomonas oryzihabitans]
MPKPTQRDLTYCTLALLLAMRIHGTESAVRDTARRCVKLLPKRQRDLMLKVVQSQQPLTLVRYLARNLD